MIPTRRAVALAGVLAVFALIAALHACTRTVDGRATSHPFRFDPATGELHWRPWTLPARLHFDVDYTNGHEPFRSTFLASQTAYFVPDVTPCAAMTWLVYSNTAGQLDGGTVTYCPERTTAP